MNTSEFISKLRGKISVYEHDSEAHRNGGCSHSIALCSAIEQEVQMAMDKILDSCIEENLT